MNKHFASFSSVEMFCIFVENIVNAVHVKPPILQMKWFCSWNSVYSMWEVVPLSLQGTLPQGVLQSIVEVSLETWRLQLEDFGLNLSLFVDHLEPLMLILTGLWEQRIEKWKIVDHWKTILCFVTN